MFCIPTVTECAPSGINELFVLSNSESSEALWINRKICFIQDKYFNFIATLYAKAVARHIDYRKKKEWRNDQDDHHSWLVVTNDDKYSIWVWVETGKCSFLQRASLRYPVWQLLVEITRYQTGTLTLINIPAPTSRMWRNMSWLILSCPFQTKLPPLTSPSQLEASYLWHLNRPSGRLSLYCVLRWRWQQLRCGLQLLNEDWRLPILTRPSPGRWWWWWWWWWPQWEGW